MLPSRELAEIAVKALDSKKGKEIRLIRIDKITTLAEYFVICTGTSNTQINALGDEVEKELTLAGEEPLHREGYRGGTWVLLDYGCIAVHVFNHEAREFYGLERLWRAHLQRRGAQVLFPRAPVGRRRGSRPERHPAPRRGKITLDKAGQNA